MTFIYKIFDFLQEDHQHDLLIVIKKKKMFRKLKSMFHSKAKKLIILPIPIPFMMEDKKLGGFGLMNGFGGGSMLSSSGSTAPSMDPWMMMSMMDCPEMMIMEDMSGHDHNKPTSVGHKQESKTYVTGPGTFVSSLSSSSQSSGHHSSPKEISQSVDNSWSKPSNPTNSYLGSNYRGAGSGPVIHHATKSSSSGANPNYFKGQTRDSSSSLSSY